ncbi:hypothetical protein [Gayadomonas joobiniege]|uniref:hypothetical protein n=1 Tax=Gayadomonas joobiniege TaxID=1234606 RepID=UPI0012DC0EE3|nr:hypothetical protein [Gayadomonas joobiniege]
MKKTQRIALNQIKDVLVIKGKGQYMGSHCLYLITDTNKYAVADSDIIPGSKGRVKSIRDELSNWIRL